MRRGLVRTLLLLTGLVLAGFGLEQAFLATLRAPGPLPGPENVLVPKGGVAEVALALRKQGVIAHRLSFRVAALATSFEGPLRAAEFAFPAQASLAETLRILRFGKPVEHSVTFPEGSTASSIAAALARDPALAGPLAVPAEGAVMPETYHFEYAATASSIIARAQAASRGALTELWRARAPGLPLRSPREALVLASIVERETARPEERPLIAAVFLNRLRAGMKLQADPTALYGASGGEGRLDRPLTHADLERDDSYNTYVLPGLPAGPICSPGHAAIEAVLHPAPTAALYFVADGTGGHAFADTLAEHHRNTEAARQ